MEENNLSLTMNVAELLNAWPQVIPVFIRHHMACVGCSMSAFETLGDAARIYGVQPETLLAELHQALNSADGYPL